ncbi:MAG: hypothetical protein DRR08_12205 [Candidatus Parabeggiatoa sp. nov. 2]|nr:MAG: hypothetical protein B6247_10770 [Beggiatoa sp. 4572_84]RKZ60092.1 MAG: hypothetical protein DRR08_12205 [Gammaproteobacteria bacterium]HEC83989.1 hypothetical protein [Thioploca sp.]
MKMVCLEQSTLDTCVNAAQEERVVITRNSKPIALIIGVEGMDEEQLQLGSSDPFWKLITERRQQKTISRAQLEQTIVNSN